tara:strand:+ start:681 stop:1172 length:492 start_codon:yes stop_codon:yes gene_type:complete
MNRNIFNNIKKLNSGTLNPPRTNKNNIDPSNINRKTKKINRQYNKSVLNGIKRKHNINVSTTKKLFIYFKYLCVVRAYADAVEMMGKKDAQKHLKGLYLNPIDNNGLFIQKVINDIINHNTIRNVSTVVNNYNKTRLIGGSKRKQEQINMGGGKRMRMAATVS